MQKINPVVAEASPNLYAAAKQANLSTNEVSQVEQMSYTIKQHRALMAMPEDKARSTYDKLDPGIQKQLNFMYKDAQYAQKAPDFGDRALGVLKGIGSVAVSPIVGLFKLAGGYSRAINTPYLVARQAAQGEDPFSIAVWKDAWDGKNVYDNGALDEVTKVYGANDVFVAKGILSGKTPGEIVQSYGKTDTGILESIQKAYNDPKNFRQVLDATKYAQVSPGRDIERMLDDKPPASGGLHGSTVGGGNKWISGTIDAVYQIAIDPLTWLTGGSTKAATLGERLAKSIEQAANNGDLAGGVAKVMQNPRVNQLWERELGPAIKTYAEAPTAAEKTLAYENIARQFPGYANRDVINTLAHADNKVYDAASAQKFFEQADNTHLMLSGRVEGVTYKRNGVAVAKSHRNYADGLMTYLDSVFNSTTSKTVGRLKSSGRTVEELQAKGDEIHSALIKTGETIDGFMNPNPDMNIINEAAKEIKGLKKFGQWAARSPAGLEIHIGERAAETAQNFTLAARQLLPRDMAEFMTTKFLESSADEQVVILRNIYAATMYKYGLGGDVNGKALIEKVLREKFGSQAGFATMRNTEVPEHFMPHLEPTSVKNLEGTPMLQSEDAIQPYHAAQTIGSLPYNEIADAVTQMRAKKNLMYAIGGSVQGPFAKKVVDAWSLLTLFPRLGVRSAIDEGLMFVLSAPATDLLAYFTRKGHKMGKVSTAFTGSEDATGPILRKLQKVIGKTGPQDAITLEKREEAMNALAKELNVAPELLRDVQKRTRIAQLAEETYGHGLDKEGLGYLTQALVYHPDMLNSMASSLVGRSGLSGRYGEEVMQAIVDPSALTMALKELNINAGRKTRSIPTRDLLNMSESHLALAHYDNWWKGFIANKVKLANNRTVNPGHVFFSNHGLKTSEDFGKAMDELAASVGVVLNKDLGTYVVKDPEAVKEFLALSARTVEMRARGLDDAYIVRDQAGRILTDLYTTFHGGAKNFNQELLDAVGKNRTRLTEEMKSEYPATWSQASAGIAFPDFMKLTAGNRPTGEINTALEFEGFTDPESLWRSKGNQMMEWMDQQINAMYRQPAITIAYAQTRKNWAGIEKQWINDYVAATIKADPERYANPKSLERLRETGKALGEKRFTELAMQDAADTVLKYADNPNIRSNFSYGVRTVGRYYRATEDFARRIYRMKDVAPRALYRMRLAHLGLNASGSVYTDQQGEMYVMMPMDNILFKATNGTLTALMGGGLSGYSQPSFNEFTVKLRMVNPSFQQDAGLPTLSGPIAGLGVIGIKNLLGYTGLTSAKQLGENIDTFALGNIGDNMDVTRAVVPASLQRLWALLPVNEKSRQEVTAAQQAVAYNAAHGIFLDASATEQDKKDYLDKMRITAHNVIFMRNLMGLIAPATPTVQEGKGVPDYLKRVGVTGLRPEFFDILNGITATKTGDVQDPYELALSTFTGKYPGKLIYTVSRDAKQTRVLVKNTDQLKNWAIQNQGLIDTYGEAAYIFAPQVGKFNAATYNYIQAAGLVQNKTLEKYYSDLLVAQDKQSYYDIGTKEKEAILATANPDERSVIIGEATAARDALKRSNPLLEKALIGTGNNIGSEGVMLQNVKQIIADPKTAVEPATRQRMAQAVRMMEEFIAFATDPAMKNVSNFSDLKRERRNQIEANLSDLMLGDLYVTEANRAIFKSILNFYSRDTYVAFQKGF